MDWQGIVFLWLGLAHITLKKAVVGAAMWQKTRPNLQWWRSRRRGYWRDYSDILNVWHIGVCNEEGEPLRPSDRRQWLPGRLLEPKHGRRWDRRLAEVYELFSALHRQKVQGGWLWQFEGVAVQAWKLCVEVGEGVGGWRWCYTDGWEY